jgi:hypothetical protein
MTPSDWSLRVHRIEAREGSFLIGHIDVNLLWFQGVLTKLGDFVSWRCTLKLGKVRSHEDGVTETLNRENAVEEREDV